MGGGKQGSVQKEGSQFEGEFLIARLLQNLTVQAPQNELSKKTERRLS
jgi:hypothetical protein